MLNIKHKQGNRVETGFIKYLSDEEFKRIESYVERLRSPSMRMCLKVLMYLGLRCSEATSLKRSNFNAEFSLLRYQLKKRKAICIKERVVPQFLSIQLKAYFRRHQKRMLPRVQDRGLRFMFFCSYANQSKNEHLQTGSIRAKFCELRKALTMKDVYYTSAIGRPMYRISPHTLRHFFLWKVYKASGNSLVTAKEIIGHKRVETTAHYICARTNAEDEKTIIEKAFQLESEKH